MTTIVACIPAAGGLSLCTVLGPNRKTRAMCGVAVLIVGTIACMASVRIGTKLGREQAQVHFVGPSRALGPVFTDLKADLENGDITTAKKTVAHLSRHWHSVDFLENSGSPNRIPWGDFLNELQSIRSKEP